ncbi:hypothetical protein BRC82_09325 [Halobacteriales archaeon QS_1_67_19]|nr:MAG: hypothetical protein BRC82_09325 [Halobacteriales archaeon QS_1_67_19]
MLNKKFSSRFARRDWHLVFVIVSHFRHGERMSRRTSDLHSFIESSLLFTKQRHVAVGPTVGSMIDTTAQDSYLGFR